MSQSKSSKRGRCRYLDIDDSRCQGSAINPHAEIVLCFTHTMRAVRSMDLTPKLLDKICPADDPDSLRIGVAKAQDREPEGHAECVYYIRRGDLIKVGTTTNLLQRMGALEPDELLAVEPGGRQREKAVHVQFRRALERGREWFVPVPELMEHIAGVKRKHGDPDPKMVAWVNDRGVGRRSPIAADPEPPLSEETINGLPPEIQAAVRRVL